MYDKSDFSAVKYANIPINQKRLAFVLSLKTKEELKLESRDVRHVDAMDVLNRTLSVAGKTLNTSLGRKVNGNEKIKIINKD